MTNYTERSVPENTLTNVHPVLAKIFASRGVISDSEMALDLAGLISPDKLKGVMDAAAFLADSIAAQKSVIVVADYDCDGATACTVAVRGLRMLGFNTVDFLVPNRIADGYGLTPGIVNQVTALQTKYDILVTVDNGIASVDGVAHANASGLEVLVTDHHLPGDEAPAAAHIVNPNQRDCTFPSKALAGVGVMFYTLLALRAELRNRGIFTRETQPRIESLLDLVALGTVADVVQLDKNNRILVNAGLKLIRTGKAHPGVKALFEVCSKRADVAASVDFGFFLGPRINAAGRMDDMSIGIRCLLADDYQESLELARKLDSLNSERRKVESGIQDSANSLLKDVIIGDAYTIALTGDQWHQGVIGIVAGRLKETHHRPTIIFADSESDGKPILKGSGRSIPGFHLRDALDIVSKRHPEIFVKFGGHAMAAGMTIHKDQFTKFQDAFEKVARELIPEDLLSHNVFHDGAIEAHNMSLDLVKEIQNQVWGQGFPEPLFASEFEVKKTRIVGGKHLQLFLQLPGSDPRSGDIAAIWFKNTECPLGTVKLVYKMQDNTYNGVTSLQLMIEGVA